jgi:nitric oxide reductase large subunit
VLEGSGSLPRTFLNIVIFWLMATFVSFGLYAPRNATVLSVLFVAALSVAAAVFLIVELDGPFDGLIRVSGEPLRFALDNLGH